MLCAFFKKRRILTPIGSGFGASLAHPGGNITGFTTNDTGAVVAAFDGPLLGIRRPNIG